MSALEVEHVSKRFGSLQAVRDVSLAVEQGALHAVIGPNGAGKTTFFNMISGLFPPTTGKIVFDGHDITALPAHRRVAAGIARTFQITEIFPELTVFENVRIGVEVAAGLRLRAWMNRAQAKQVREHIDDVLALTGLDAHGYRLVGELSHGEQRVVEVAMALALRPRLLLLDEPAAGMGDQETEAITRLISRLHEDSRLTIVLIEHDMRVVFDLADRITVLDRGSVLAEGAPEAIAANEAVQAAYLGVAV